MAMIVAIGTCEMHLPEVHSLKEKRQVLRCIIDRVQSKFNVSIAEVDQNDLWQRCTLGIAMVANDRVLLEQMGQKIDDIIAGHDQINGHHLDWEFV
jgi:uncharacterized protein